MLKTDDILDAVRSVLAAAKQGKGERPQFLTAYQILDRLPEQLRQQLIAERGLGGKGAGTHYAAPSLVSDAAERIQGIEIEYLDTEGLGIAVQGTPIEPGYQLAGIYRLPE